MGCLILKSKDNNKFKDMDTNKVNINQDKRTPSTHSRMISGIKPSLHKHRHRPQIKDRVVSLLRPHLYIPPTQHREQVQVPTTIAHTPRSLMSVQTYAPHPNLGQGSHNHIRPPLLPPSPSQRKQTAHHNGLLLSGVSVLVPHRTLVPI
jgi:hypothetical protein